MFLNNAGTQRTREGIFELEKIANFERVNQKFYEMNCSEKNFCNNDDSSCFKLLDWEPK